MAKSYSDLVHYLKNKKETIATMESCTGGGVANCITNQEGASEVFQLGAVTYSNTAKIKLGVSSSVIDTYSVYSIETAREMAHAISMTADSDYGLGITGKLKRTDVNNLSQSGDDLVYLSIWERATDQYFDCTLKAIRENRAENKMDIESKVISLFFKAVG